VLPTHDYPHVLPGLTTKWNEEKKSVCGEKKCHLKWLSLELFTPQKDETNKKENGQRL